MMKPLRILSLILLLSVTAYAGDIETPPIMESDSTAVSVFLVPVQLALQILSL